MPFPEAPARAGGRGRLCAPLPAAPQARDAAFASGCRFVRISLNFLAAAERQHTSATGSAGAGEGGRRGREGPLRPAARGQQPGRAALPLPAAAAAGLTACSSGCLRGAWRGERRKERGCKTGFLLECLFDFFLFVFCFVFLSFLLADKTGQGVFVGETEVGKVFQK